MERKRKYQEGEIKMGRKVKAEEEKYTQINDEFRIVFSTRDFYLEKLKTVKDKKGEKESLKWVKCSGFHTNIASLIRSYDKNNICKLSEKPGLDNFFNAMREHERTIQTMIEGIEKNYGFSGEERVVYVTEKVYLTKTVVESGKNKKPKTKKVSVKKKKKVESSNPAKKKASKKSEAEENDLF